LPDLPTAATRVASLLHPVVHKPLGSSTSRVKAGEAESEDVSNIDSGVWVAATRTREGVEGCRQTVVMGEPTEIERPSFRSPPASTGSV
jgi:hypothetical protein